MNRTPRTFQGGHVYSNQDRTRCSGGSAVANEASMRRVWLALDWISLSRKTRERNMLPIPLTPKTRRRPPREPKTMQNSGIMHISAPDAATSTGASRGTRQTTRTPSTAPTPPAHSSLPAAASRRNSLPRPDPNAFLGGSQPPGVWCAPAGPVSPDTGCQICFLSSPRICGLGRRPADATPACSVYFEVSSASAPPERPRCGSKGSATTPRFAFRRVRPFPSTADSEAGSYGTSCGCSTVNRANGIALYRPLCFLRRVQLSAQHPERLRAKYGHARF
jgi:hypothetical protein